VTWEFGRIDLAATDYVTESDLDCRRLDPVPVTAVQQIYRDYCAHKHFRSVMPMIAGRLTASNTEIWGYHDQDQLVAWSMYRIWDDKNILSDHFAWNYRNPKLRLGIRSLENECAIYRERGYRWMYFEAVEPYMLDIKGFEILGPIT
jgi:hypothetical protein